MNVVSPSLRRRSLASFENAYAVALRIREASGTDQFIVQTDNPIQPFRVSGKPPSAPEIILACVA